MISPHISLIEDSCDSKFPVVIDQISYSDDESSISTYFKNHSTPAKCSKCLSTQLVTHEWNRQQSIQNAVEMLERKGITNEVLANILRKLACKTKSPEVEMDSLKVQVSCTGLFQKY